MRTQVAIVGAGPAGLLLSHLLDREGVDSVVVERSTREHVESRVRAGILENATVELLDSVGLGERMNRVGLRHRGIHLHWPGRRHHVDFVDLVGHGVRVYGQTELTADLGRARDVAGQRFHYGVRDTAAHDLTTEHPSLAFTDADGRPVTIEADVVVGCDGARSSTRGLVPQHRRETWERTLPYSWLGILADTAPSTDELIYAWHPHGFALHSMRSPEVSRFYLQVPADTDPDDWSDDRIWDELATRLGHGQDGWTLTPGPITQKTVTAMHAFVTAPLRHGRLFLAGDAAHIVPPTGAKGLNLAFADVALLAPALAALVRRNDPDPADTYSDRALARVWRSTHFALWMTEMLHVGSDDPFAARLQLAQLERVASSTAAATELADNYTGLPLELRT